MGGFSPTEAAFVGFRIVRERPRAVIAWALLQILVGLSLTSFFIGTSGPSLGAMQADALQAMPPDRLLAVFGKVLPAYAVALAISIVIQAVFLAAMGRAVFRPDDDRFGYLRLGRVEALQVSVVFLLVVVEFAVAFLVAFLLAIVGALAANAAGGGTPASAFALFAGAAGIAAMLVVAVRLSLAPATAFVTGRISLSTSWRLTRGRFWPLAGTYILALFLAAVVYVLGIAITMAVVAVAGGGLGAVSQLFVPDTSSLAAYLTRARLIDLVFSGVLAALTWPVVVAPSFIIYRSLAGGGGAAAPHPWSAT